MKGMTTLSGLLYMCGIEMIKVLPQAGSFTASLAHNEKIE
jgi:hypothetical protein